MIWKFKNNELHFFLNPVIFLDMWERFDKKHLAESDSWGTTSPWLLSYHFFYYLLTTKTPRLVAHYKDEDPETGLFSKIIQLSEMAAHSQDVQGSVFDKIEIISPNNLLKVGD